MAPSLARSRGALAARAVERAAAPDDGPPDLRAAARAGLAVPPVRLEFALHAATLSLRVDVVGERRAAEADALAQDPAQRLVEARGLVGLQRARGPERMDPRAPKRLDRVDVADPRDATAVEEERLDRAPRAPREERAEPGQREAARERLHAERAVQVAAGAARGAPVRGDVRARDERHPPELADVRERKRAAVGEGDRPAHEAVAVRRAGLVEEQLSGHAQRDDERLARVELENNELAAPAHGLDAASAKACRDERRRVRLGELVPIRVKAAHRAADDHTAQLPRDRLDLG